MNARKFDIAINKLYPGVKLGDGDTRWGRFTASFYTESHSIDSLISRVTKDGFSFCPVMDKSYRKTANFISAQHIGLDDDRGTTESSLEALEEDPFIADHAAFLYETPSSTPEHPKARIVFILDTPFTNADEYRTAQEAMWSKFGATDAHVKEPARFFWGRVNAQSINLGNVLYRDVLQEHVIEPFQLHQKNSGNGYRTAETIGETIPDGDRNSTLFSMGCTMRRRGFGQASITAALLIENQGKCCPPLPDEEVQNIAASVCRYEPNHRSVSQIPAGPNTHKKKYIPSMVIEL